MTDYLLAFASRAAVMLPVILMMAAFLWWLLRRFVPLPPDLAFNAFDMRTWPLRFALADAAVFATVFAAIAAAMPDSSWGAGAAAGGAALVAIGIAPYLAARVLR